MNDAEFWGKYDDPRWQRKRLDVCNAARWTCEDCGDTKKTLHVHHNYYVKGRSPWEYTRNSLMSLCKDCHKKRQSAELNAKQWFGLSLRFSTVEEIEANTNIIAARVTNNPRYIPTKDNPPPAAGRAPADDLPSAEASMDHDKPVSRKVGLKAFAIMRRRHAKCDKCGSKKDCALHFSDQPEDVRLLCAKCRERAEVRETKRLASAFSTTE